MHTSVTTSSHARLSLLAPPLEAELRSAWVQSVWNEAPFQGVLLESRSGGKDLRLLSRDLPTELYNEHELGREAELANWIRTQGHVALLSDAGFPVQGDPGGALLRACHRLGSIEFRCKGVHSPISYALLVSGCDGNSVFFHGYPPRSGHPFRAWLRTHPKATHQWIDPPYRLAESFTALLEVLPENAWCSLSLDIGLPTETHIARSISEWRTLPFPEVEKRLGVVTFSC